MEIPIITLSFEFLFTYYLCSFFVASIAAFIFIRAIATHNVLHHKYLLGIILIVIAGTNIFTGITLASRASKVPALSRTTPKNSQILPANHPTIRIEFTDPVVFSTVKINTFPENELTVTPHGYLFNIIPIGRSLSISPSKSYTPGSTIMVYVSNIEGPLTHGFGGETLLELQSEALPQVESITSPAQVYDVATNQEIRLRLDKAAEALSSWQVRSNPEMQFDLSSNGNEIIIKPKSPYKQSTMYTVVASQFPYITDYKTQDRTLGFTAATETTIQFTTVSPPFVKHISPSGETIFPEQDIVVDFKHPMNASESGKFITILSGAPHRVIWEENDTRLKIKHDTLPKQSSVSATLRRGLQTKLGGSIEDDIRYEFKTPGPVALLTTTPRNGETGVLTDTPIELTVNQPVEKTSIVRAVSVSPAFEYTTIASESSILILPTGKLKPDTTYTIRLSPSVQSVYGLPAQNTMSISFSTGSPQTLLQVPFYKQESSFTCNVAAAKMLLAYRRIQVSEQAIIDAMGSGGKRGSGNPHLGYVSDYGTYWSAISKGVSHFAPNTVIQNGTLRQIISYIQSGIPVMIWGQNGWSDPHDISWTTPDGLYIKAINGMHSSVVRGFAGTADNPTDIFLNDPWRGQYSIPVKEFLRRWGYFNTALILDK